MKIKQVVVGELEANCYLLEMDHNMLVIDPGSEKEKIEQEIEESHSKVLGILITHGHFDHIGAKEELKEKYSCSVYEDSNLEEKTYSLGPFSFEVIKTKGHSKDSVSYYFPKEKVIFTGDFLFRESIGRCDLEGGDWTEMLESIQKIKEYSEEITIYPGHGEMTTLLHEKEKNIYFLV